MESFPVSANRKIRSGDGDFFVSTPETSVHQNICPQQNNDFLRLQDGMSMVDGDLIVTLRGHQIYSVGILNFHASILANIVKSSNLKMKTVAGTFTSANRKKLQTRWDVAPPTLEN